MSDAHVGELVELLELERLEDNLFRGQSRDIGTRFVFGGQVLGQALSAAQRTVDPKREAHSLHAYFLRAGDINAPIVYNDEETGKWKPAKSDASRQFPVVFSPLWERGLPAMAAPRFPAYPLHSPQH